MSWSTLDRLSPIVGRVSIMYRSTCRLSGNRHVGRGLIEVSIASIDRHLIAGVISTHDPLSLNEVLKPGLVSVVTVHMVYFCGFASSEIIQKTPWN